eukprot:2354283-Pyramimonas_sp.AAC.1
MATGGHRRAAVNEGGDVPRRFHCDFKNDDGQRCGETFPTMKARLLSMRAVLAELGTRPLY